MTPKGKRHTMAREDVIESIINMRIQKGCSYITIMNFITEELGFAKSYAYELIRDAKTEINERAIINFGEDLKEDIERFEQLYFKAIQENNRKEARECLKEISKLKGHYVERQDITSGGKAIQEIKLIHITNGNFGNQND